MWDEYYRSDDGERTVHIKTEENKTICQMPLEIKMSEHQSTDEMLLHAEAFTLASKMYEDI